MIYSARSELQKSSQRFYESDDRCVFFASFDLRKFWTRLPRLAFTDGFQLWDVHRPQPDNSELVFVINCCVIFKDASDSLHRPSDAAGLRCLWNPVPAVDVNSVSYILSFFN